MILGVSSELGNSDRRMLLAVRPLPTRRRCPLDRVQTLTLIGASLPNSTYRCVNAAGFLAKQIAVLDYETSRVLQVEVNSPRLLRRVLRIFHNGFVGVHKSVFNMTNGKRLVGTSGRRPLDFTRKHPCTIAQRVHAALLRWRERKCVVVNGLAFGCGIVVGDHYGFSCW